MTRNFLETGTKILKILRDKQKISDVMLMIELDFNPETWRHWRAKFIELFNEVQCTKTDSDNQEKIVYLKKQKLWVLQDV